MKPKHFLPPLKLSACVLLEVGSSALWVFLSGLPPSSVFLIAETL